MARKRKTPSVTNPPQEAREPLGMPSVEPAAPTTYVAPVDPPSKWAKYMPSRKWIVSTVGAIGTLAIMWATTGTWDLEETVGAITLAVTAFSTWLVPNATGNPNEPENT